MIMVPYRMTLNLNMKNQTIYNIFLMKILILSRIKRKEPFISQILRVMTFSAMLLTLHSSPMVLMFMLLRSGRRPATLMVSMNC